MSKNKPTNGTPKKVEMQIVDFGKVTNKQYLI